MRSPGRRISQTAQMDNHGSTLSWPPQAGVFLSSPPSIWRDALGSLNLENDALPTVCTDLEDSDECPNAVHSCVFLQNKECLQKAQISNQSYFAFWASSTTTTSTAIPSEIATFERLLPQKPSCVHGQHQSRMLITWAPGKILLPLAFRSQTKGMPPPPPPPKTE